MRIHISAYDAMGFIQWNVAYTADEARRPEAQHVVGGYYRWQPSDDQDEELFALVSAIWGALKLRRES